MKAIFLKSFVRDLKKIANQTVRDQIGRAIERVEHASGITDIGQLKKLAGSSTFYRIRVGDYRLGLIIRNQTVEFVRCLYRRDIYRFFP